MSDRRWRKPRWGLKAKYDKDSCDIFGEIVPGFGCMLWCVNYDLCRYTYYLRHGYEKNKPVYKGKGSPPREGVKRERAEGQVILS